VLRYDIYIYIYIYMSLGFKRLMHGCCAIGVLNCDYRSSSNWPPLATKVDWSDIAVARIGFLSMLEVPGSKLASFFFSEKCRM